jgi:hypothetical protein
LFGDFWADLSNLFNTESGIENMADATEWRPPKPKIPRLQSVQGQGARNAWLALAL